MKIAVLIFTTISLTIFNHVVIAENGRSMMAPPGPYRSSTDIDQNALNKMVQNKTPIEERSQYSAHQIDELKNMPGWMRQHQAQMESWMRQANTLPKQTWDNSQPQWNYYQAPPMHNSYPAYVPNGQVNRMQQFFPSARGPVYGPGAPPEEMYPPRYPSPRY